MAPALTIPPAPLSAPAWLHDNAFTLPEVADLLGASFQTLAGWLDTARTIGRPLHQKRKHRRLVTGHGAYVLSVLAAVRRAGINVNADIIAQVHTATHRDDAPVLPDLFDQIHIAETDIDGAPVARIEIEAGTIWLSLEPKLELLLTTHG